MSDRRTPSRPCPALATPAAPVQGVRGAATSALLAGGVALAWGLAAIATAPAAQAQTPYASAPAQGWSQQAQHWIEQQWQQNRDSNAPSQLRPEIIVGQLDTRLRLAPCQRVEPFLPPNTRLWGRSRIGLRCVQGPTPWRVFLPITVKAWGPAWTVRQTLTPGTVLTRDMAEQTEVDWAEGVSPVLPSEEQWVGNEAVRAILPGQVLRQNMVRAPQLFSSGTQVKVVASGKGFALNANGEAVGHGYLGQSVRVRMASGRVIVGVVRSADTVEIQI